MNDKPIIVSYPCGDMIHASFTHCLSLMLLYSVVKPRLWVGVSQTRGSIICASRNMMVSQAINSASGFSHLLFLDSDMIFPYDTLERLLKHDKPIVGGSYCMRREPRAMTHRDGEFKSYLPTIGDYPNDIFPVLSMGMGCILIRAEVFDQLRAIDPLGPFFQITYHGGDHHTGEDVNFFQKVNRAGIPVFCDLRLTNEIRHTGTYDYGPEDVQKWYDGTEPRYDMTSLLLPDHKEYGDD